MTIGTATASDAPITLTGGTLTGTAGVALSATVATISETVSGGNPLDGGGEPATDFIATIDWGDGTTTAGIVSQLSGVELQGLPFYNVAGTHTYATGGTFTVHTTIVRDGISTSTDGVATIAPNRGTPHEQYVVAVFQAVLDRAVDPAGLAYWARQLDGGMQVSSVAEAIAHSDEYYGNFVIGPAYLQLLGRAADITGTIYWIDQIRNGLTDQKLEAEFISSDEFYAHAGGTDVDWIDAVYNQLLGRPAAAADESFWSGRLAAGYTRAEVAAQIAGSQENNAQLINDDYFHYLGRAADADGLAFWLKQFADGQTNEDVIAGFTGSAEYYQEHS